LDFQKVEALAFQLDCATKYRLHLCQLVGISGDEIEFKRSHIQIPLTRRVKELLGGVFAKWLKRKIEEVFPFGGWRSASDQQLERVSVFFSRL